LSDRQSADTFKFLFRLNMIIKTFRLISSLIVSKEIYT
jgi:hypothetical protein